MSYGVTYVSPTWCFAGLPAETDFSLTEQDSPSGYAGVIPQSPYLRYYSRAACESLGGVYNANGECYGVNVDGLLYNATQICAGLNDNTNDNIAIPVAELDFLCPPSKSDNSYYIVAIGVLSVLAGLAILLLHRK